jgi:hypothetical protein
MPVDVHVHRPSGLLVAFDPPELTIEQAIRRRWEMDDDELLMIPKRREFLATRPLTGRDIVNWYHGMEWF